MTACDRDRECECSEETFQGPIILQDIVKSVLVGIKSSLWTIMPKGPKRSAYVHLDRLVLQSNAKNREPGIMYLKWKQFVPKQKEGKIPRLDSWAYLEADRWGAVVGLRAHRSNSSGVGCDTAVLSLLIVTSLRPRV